MSKFKFKILFIVVFSFNLLKIQPTEAISTAFAYITNISSNDVSVIDTSTNIVMATIPVDLAPVGVSVSPDGSRVYVANLTSNTLSVINTDTNTVIATIPVGNEPFGVGVTADGTKVYVANEADNTVSVIDTSTNQIMGLPIDVGVNPEGIVYNTINGKIYITNNGSGNLSVIDPSTETVLDTIELPDGGSSHPRGITVDTITGFLYVASLSVPGLVYVVDPSTNVAQTITGVGDSLQGITYSRTLNKIYTANTNSNTVSEIDPTTNTVTNTFSVGTNPIGVSTVRDLIYSANTSSNTVSSINGLIGTITTITTNIGSGPRSFGNFITPLPAATLSETALQFSSQLANTSSNPQTVTLTNDGNGTLTISNITSTSSYQSSSNCPTTLNPGASCTISITFHPSNGGEQDGIVSIIDNADDSPQIITLSGIGEGGKLGGNGCSLARKDQFSPFGLYFIFISIAVIFSKRWMVMIEKK